MCGLYLDRMGTAVPVLDANGKILGYATQVVSAVANTTTTAQVAPALSGISVAPSTAAITLGATQAFSATCSDQSKARIPRRGSHEGRRTPHQHVRLPPQHSISVHYGRRR
jgi:hypothetical protein